MYADRHPCSPKFIILLTTHLSSSCSGSAAILVLTCVRMWPTKWQHGPHVAGSLITLPSCAEETPQSCLWLIASVAPHCNDDFCYLCSAQHTSNVSYKKTVRKKGITLKCNNHVLYWRTIIFFLVYPPHKYFWGECGAKYDIKIKWRKKKFAFTLTFRHFPYVPMTLNGTPNTYLVTKSNLCPSHRGEYSALSYTVL